MARVLAGPGSPRRVHRRRGQQPKSPALNGTGSATTRTDAALVHDYFVQDGGAERVAIELSRLLPDAPVYTTFFDRSTFGGSVEPGRVKTWPLDGRVAMRRFRSLLPLYPIYFSTLDLRDARLVISSSSSFAKAVRTSRRTTHVAYIHTPMRFAWQRAAYVDGSSLGIPARLGSHLLRAPLAAWDRRTAHRPDLLVANSRTVQARIRRNWGRDAEVIHPPVDIEEFRLTTDDRGYLLIAARLLAYRRIDLVIAAANALRRELVIAGDGPERLALERLAGPTIRFVGHVPRHSLVELFGGCHAYLVASEEDFGISAVEAMAAGKPVVAYARGGATETVVDGQTGVLFEMQSTAGIIEAIERLDDLRLDQYVMRKQAEQFGRSQFFAAWRALLERLGVDSSLYLAGDAQPVAAATD